MIFSFMVSGKPAAEGKALTEKKASKEHVSQEEGELQENGIARQNNDDLKAQVGRPIDQHHFSDEKSIGSRF